MGDAVWKLGWVSVSVDVVCRLRVADCVGGCGGEAEGGRLSCVGECGGETKGG